MGFRIGNESARVLLESEGLLGDVGAVPLDVALHELAMLASTILEEARAIAGILLIVSAGLDKEPRVICNGNLLSNARRELWDLSALTLSRNALANPPRFSPRLLPIGKLISSIGNVTRATIKLLKHRSGNFFG